MRLLRMSCIVSLLAFSLFSAGQEASKPSADPDAHRFHLTSTNFENHTTLPLSTLSNIPGPAAQTNARSTEARAETSLPNSHGDMPGRRRRVL